MRAVFLDAGQTLLDAEPRVATVYRDGFSRYGVETTEESVEAALDATWTEVARLSTEGRERWRGAAGEKGFWRSFVQTIYAAVGGGDELPAALFAELVAHFAHSGSWKVDEDARDVLPLLRARGLKLVVVSNWDSSLPGLLDRLGLTPLVDGVVVSALVGASKPSRKIFDVALSMAGVAPEEALHVGDSITEDYEGARAAGLGALLLDRRGRAGDGYEAVRSLSELPSRLWRAP